MLIIKDRPSLYYNRFKIFVNPQNVEQNVQDKNLFERFIGV